MNKEFSRYLSDTDVKKIESAIADAEKNTSCEIVPVIVSRSDHYHHANYISGFIFSLLAIAVCWISFPPADFYQLFWQKPTQMEYLLVLCLVSVLGFMFGAFISDRFDFFKLLFISPKEMRFRVMRYANQLFRELHVNRTQDATGIIIVISLYEHIVHIEGDATVNQHFQQSDWDQARDHIVSGIKQGQLAQGLSKAIKALGDIVNEKLPIAKDDNNELINTLHFREGY